MTQPTALNYILVILGLALFAGCVEKDRYREAARVAEKAADRQAEQNTEMAQLNREVAEGTKRMVTADAEVRKEIIAVHQELQAERVVLNDGFDKLEVERKQIATERRTESMVLPAAKVTGMILFAVIVVGFCWTLLFGLRSGTTTDAELTELLLNDLARDEPRLLRPADARSAIEHRHVDDSSDQSALGHASDLSDGSTLQGEAN